MAKSNLKLLQEAIEDGDLDMAKILLAKIEGKKKRNNQMEPEDPPMPIKQKSKNKYKPPREPSKFDKVDQILAAQGVGSDIPRRPPVSKVRVSCDRCGSSRMVYPREIQSSYDESGRRVQYYRCDGCIGR